MIFFIYCKLVNIYCFRKSVLTCECSQLERIVGTSAAKRMVSSDKKMFVFCWISQFAFEWKDGFVTTRWGITSSLFSLSFLFFLKFNCVITGSWTLAAGVNVTTPCKPCLLPMFLVWHFLFLFLFFKSWKFVLIRRYQGTRMPFLHSCSLCYAKPLISILFKLSGIQLLYLIDKISF